MVKSVSFLWAKEGSTSSPGSQGNSLGCTVDVVVVDVLVEVVVEVEVDVVEGTRTIVSSEGSAQ